jgi:hypothetical protein
MNANEIALLAKATMDRSMPFPKIVCKLIVDGVWQVVMKEHRTQSVACCGATCRA